MGKYLDRLTAEFDELTAGVTAVLERAADENREINADETKLIERDDTRRDELTKAIEHYTAVEERQGKVSALRSRVAALPSFVSGRAPAEPEYDLAREYPTVGHYAIDFHRATVLRDRDAQERIERATAHQTTADNPGLIPRPILGPVINMIEASRPFVQSITTRPLPAGKFDRPKITQHVDVDVQTAEKQETASQKLRVDNLPVTAKTYAGHLNISRQDIKWSSPAILTIVYEDFATVYAIRTCDDAVAQFVASVTETVAIATADAQGITSALYTAAAAGLARSDRLPDTLWVAPDVWARMGGMVGPLGQPSFPSLSLTGQGGNPLGLRLVVDQHFPAGTMIAGPAAFAEWYEDVDGLLSVDEPNVLGQMVGYAGYGAFINVAPEAFTAFTLPDPDDDGGVGTEAAASSTSGSGGSGSK